MDWPRSEDLKEEKNVTASVLIIAVEACFALCRYQAAFTRRSMRLIGIYQQ